MSTINHFQGYAFVKKTGDRIDVFEGPHTLADFMPVISDGSSVPRMLRDRFADAVNVADFGAKGDGVTNDTAALEDAFASGNKAFYLKGSFLINHLSIPDDVVLFGAPEFVDAGTQQADQYVLELGARVKAEHISLKMVNNDIYRWGVSVGENDRIGDIRVYADSYVNSEAIHQTATTGFTSRRQTSLRLETCGLREFLSMVFALAATTLGFQATGR